MHSYRRFSPVYNPIANAKITCSTPVCTFVQLTARLNYYIMTTRYPLNVTLPDLFRIILICISLSPSIEAQSLKLWYRQPADALAPDTRPAYEDDPAWLSALPLGNGSLGAMVFGDVNKERIQLNEKTLWSGSPSDNNNPEAVRYIDTIRQLLFEGKFKEATELTNRTQVCKGAGSGHGSGANVPFGCFQTLGDLWIDFGRNSEYANYYRDLNLETAQANVRYTQDGVRFTREYFISAPDNMLVVRLTASKKGALSFKTILSRPERFSLRNKDKQLVMSGSLSNGKGGDGMKYIVRLQAKTKDGTQTIQANQLVIQNATEVILYLTASTDYQPNYPIYKGREYLELTRLGMEKAMAKTYTDLKRDHLNDYQKFFNRVSLTLAAEAPDTVPTDLRLQRIQKTGADPFLTQLYFQYGRYLLISSARENTLPANLQGIWANKIQTPWNCDYHTNINVQMNYWLAESTNLSELHLSLTDFVRSIEAPATQSARVQFGRSGWCINPIVNVWGFTAPGEHPSWGLTSGASGWIAQHLWEHYAFTLDTAYLRTVYPTLKNAARFYLDWLTTDPATGKLVSGPASSPENAFYAPDGSQASISMGPAHDQEIIAELFDNVLAAAAILQDQEEVIARIKAARQKLMGNQIGPDGRLMEWAQPYAEVEPGHRHISHIYAVHPGYAITHERAPELFEAAQKTLVYRLEHGGGHTGWSAAWVTNLWARFKNGNKALEAFNNLLTKKSAPNLFDLHPPFQIDGNFGAAAGIAEMLLQSHEGFVDLLPALPDSWKNGEVKGLRARGGITVDIQWKNGRMVQTSLMADHSTTVRVKYQGQEDRIQLIPGSKKHLKVDDFSE